MARSVITVAQRVAREQGADVIDTADLFVALAQTEGSNSAQALAALHVAPSRRGRALAARLRHRKSPDLIPMSRDLWTTIGGAMRQADNADAAQVGTEHLLLALVVEGHGPGGRQVRELGLTAAAVRSALEKIDQRERAVSVTPLVAEGPAAPDVLGAGSDEAER